MGKRLRFRLTNVISRVLLINLKRGGRIKPGKKKSTTEEEAASLIGGSKKKFQPQQQQKPKGGMFRYSCCRQEEAIHEDCQRKVVVKDESLWEREGFWNVVAEVDHKVVRKKVVLRKRKSSRSRNTSSSSASPSSSSAGKAVQAEHQNSRLVVNTTFRLSTSSGDASVDQPEGLAWDKEHSLFASDDSGVNHHRRATSSESTTEVDEQDHRGSTSRFTHRRHTSTTSTSSFERHEEILLLSPSTSCHQRASARRLSALESNVKSWEVKSRCSKKKVAESDEEEEEEEVPCLKAAKGKVRESIPVMLVSSDPYADFRQSMLQMITEKRLHRAGDLEELLECYLYLNPPAFHDVIVQAFTDLWLHVLQSSDVQLQQQQQQQQRKKKVPQHCLETVSGASGRLKR